MIKNMEIIIIVLIVFFFALIIATLGNYADNSSDSDFISYHNYDDRLDEITSQDRGTPAEHKLISALLDYGIPPKAIFHDLYVKNGKYGFSQIDVAVATRVGIIVFEIKDYSGWIFGKGQQNQWTQVLTYGFRYKRINKYRFYNPILQNESHIPQSSILGTNILICISSSSKSRFLYKPIKIPFNISSS